MPKEGEAVVGAAAELEPARVEVETAERVALVAAAAVAPAGVEPAAMQPGVVQEPEPAAAMGPEPDQARPQARASARARQPPSALARARPLVPVRPGVRGWAPAPAHQWVPARVAPLDKEPDTVLVTEQGTRVSDLRTEPVLERPSRPIEKCCESCSEKPPPRGGGFSSLGGLRRLGRCRAPTIRFMTAIV
jgi:hypothetical protein